MDRELTCIVCPMGCHLLVHQEETGELTVTGNTCPRGKAYGINECTHPMRTVTSTVLLSDGTPLAVKTDRNIPKDKMGDCMKRIKEIRAERPVKIGEVLLKDVFGADIVATENAY